MDILPKDENEEKEKVDYAKRINFQFAKPSNTPFMRMIMESPTFLLDTNTGKMIQIVRE